MIVDRGISAVLDVSDMTVGEMHRFVSAFADRFFDRKKRNPSPVHVFLEEAHTFLPQQLPPEPAAAVMLHRMERIVRVGRNYGIGTSQISQLPQAVTKKTLNTVACLFAFGTIGSQERKALAAWFDQNGGGDLAKELPGLPTGTAFAVSPRWLRITKKLVIAAKQTFDSSETPKFGGAPPTPKVLAPVDVEHLRAAMAETIAAAEKDDPKALRKRIAELERELKAKPAAPAPKVETKTVEKPVLKDGQLNRVEGLVAKLFQMQTAIGAEIQPLIAALNAVKAGPPTLPPPAPKGGWQVARPAPRAPVEGPTTPAQAEGATGETKLGRCEMAILSALAIRFPHQLTHDQVAILSGYSGSSSGFQNALGKLRSGRLIVTSGGLNALTLEGKELVSDVTVPATPQALYDHWCGKLGKCERALLSTLVRMYPTALTKDVLAQDSGYSASSSGFQNALGKLRTLTLAVNDAGGVRASDEIRWRLA
jgi:hypothetical protein